VDESFYRPGGPSFIYIGGEGPMGGPASGLITDLASSHGAKIYSLEHRFYGESLPEHSVDVALSVDYLKFHAVEQSLADLASFIDAFTAGEEWFAVGGSYPGALSSWFRIAYPNKTVGSLSSSGVVNALFSFPQFDEQVATSAGDECAAAVRATTTALEAAYDADSTATKALFHVAADGLTWSADFWYMVADSAAMAVQYGNKASLCDPLTAAFEAGGDLVTTFANITNAVWGESFGSDCFYDTNCLADSGSADRWQPTARSWRWQKCFQLAYFQVAPAEGSLRSARVDMQYHLDQCDKAFGAGATDPEAATAAWNAKMGADKPADFQTFFSNGSDDPWQQASISPLDSDSETEPAVLAVCDTCGHCGDLHAPRSDQPDNLTAQQAAITSYVAKWLTTAPQQ
jgi:hypothetical protein